MNYLEPSRNLTGSRIRDCSSRITRLAILSALLISLVVLSSGETTYRYPGQDLRSQWTAQGCINHYSCLNEETITPAVPDTSDFITADPSSSLIDVYSVTGTLPRDVNWLTLNIYANITGNAQIQSDIINGSSVAENSLVDENTTAWTSINWSSPSKPFNLSSRFQAQSGGGTQSNASIYSWYFEIDYSNNPPLWRNLNQNKTSVTSSEPLKLSAQGKDRLNLTNATLATNETGSWQNITGKYGSPLQIGQRNEWVWTNFT